MIAPQSVLDLVAGRPADAFTMVTGAGAIYLMRGTDCFGEIRQQDGEWIASGYDDEGRNGTFPTFAAAARVVVSAAWRKVEETIQ